MEGFLEMNILQVVPYFNPKFGGDVNVCYNISKELTKIGHDVTILTTNFEFDKDYADSIPKVNVVSFECYFNILFFLYSPMMKKWLKNNIKDFDVIHLHTFRSYQNNIIHKYSGKFNIPYVLQAHGSMPGNAQKQNLKRLYDATWGRSILCDASKLVALNKTELYQYEKMGATADKIEVVPNGINLSECVNLTEEMGFRKKYGINDNEKIILYVGRLHKTKGLDLLVKAFGDVSKNLDDVKLVFVGPDDGYKSSLENFIQGLNLENKVVFTGFVSQEEKMGTYADADVFVTPNFSGFPITFLEACASGTPIVTTNNGDNLDWIHDNVGYVVDYDKDQLFDAIDRILSDQSLRKSFDIRCKKLVKENFVWSKVVKNIESLYMHCLN